MRHGHQDRLAKCPGIRHRQNMNAKELLEWRLRLGLSRRDAADLLRLTESGYYRNETGSREVSPPVVRLAQLAEKLGVDVIGG
jgi:transcriptional regulator with XRE-family HTH domain